MSKKRTIEELEEFIKPQVHFLTKSSSEYDNGDVLEAIRIAGHLRTLLLGDTALLHQLDMRDSLFVYDTAMPRGAFGGIKLGSGSSTASRGLIVAPTPNSFYSGLVCKEIQPDKDGIIFMKCSAWCEPMHLHKKISFQEWWETVVFDDHKDYKLTRKDIISLVANKDGYAHVNDNPPLKYLVFKNSDIVGLDINGEILKAENIPIYPTVRQIAFEFTSSFFESYSQYKV